MIKIDHLSKKYNDNVVLDDISLEIRTNWFGIQQMNR